METNELQIRASIRDLQATLLGGPPELRIHIEPEHTFLDGIYIRKLTLPPGAIIVGATHKKDHIFAIGKGRVDLINEKGLQNLKGPKFFIGHAGTKRAFRAGQLGAELLTIHANPSNTRDIKQLERELVEETL